MDMMALKEEEKLSLEELNRYYDSLCKYARGRKLSNTTFGAVAIAPKLKGITNIVADKLTGVLAGGGCGEDIGWPEKYSGWYGYFCPYPSGNFR